MHLITPFTPQGRARTLAASLALCAHLLAIPAEAGTQEQEKLSPAVQTTLQQAINDARQPRLVFASQAEGDAWLKTMMGRLQKRVPDEFMRKRLLTLIQYEATRAGLDPQMVMGLIQAESGFKKYAISPVGARGLMQVMPFWQKLIGTDKHNLFDEATNLRFGCTIMRHYLDMEHGNLYMALGRYNGSRGRPEYPNMVVGAWRANWTYP